MTTQHPASDKLMINLFIKCLRAYSDIGIALMHILSNRIT